VARVLWSQKQDVGPSPRMHHAFTYDAAREQVVLFGGDLLDGTSAGVRSRSDGRDSSGVSASSEARASIVLPIVTRLVRRGSGQRRSRG
jgi:hypothetical protein